MFVACSAGDKKTNQSSSDIFLLGDGATGHTCGTRSQFCKDTRRKIFWPVGKPKAKNNRYESLSSVLVGVARAEKSTAVQVSQTRSSSGFQLHKQQR